MSYYQGWQADIAQARDSVKGFFDTPPLRECIEYAITEAGELLDADLRLRRPGDDRTRPRDDVGKEIGQIVFMVGSALNHVNKEIPWPYSDAAMPQTVKDMFANEDSGGLAVFIVQALCDAHCNIDDTDLMCDFLYCAIVGVIAFAVLRGHYPIGELYEWLAELMDRKPQS